MGQDARSTDSMVMTVAEGRGRISVGNQRFDFAENDVVAVPGWQWRSRRASSDRFLFFFSDRVGHEKSGFFREERQAV